MINMSICERKLLEVHCVFGCGCESIIFLICRRPHKGFSQENKKEKKDMKERGNTGERRERNKLEKLLTIGIPSAH